MIMIAEAGASRLSDVMAVMADAFDPGFGEAWTEPQCRGILIMPGVWMAIAVDAAGPQGFSIARVVADEAELLLLGVRAASRRRGLGSALLTTFRESARTRGARRLHLEMREGNAAIAMYNAAGFQQVGRRRDYYRGPAAVCFDALTLACTID